jgi:hypothetical protein
MNNAPRSACTGEEPQHGKQIIAIVLRSAKRKLVSLESRVNQHRSNAIREAAHLAAADEARRDRKSRNTDWCEEARGKDESLPVLQPSELFGGKGRGDFAAGSADRRRCCGRKGDHDSQAVSP